MYKENKPKNENLQLGWKSVDEISLSLLSGYDAQAENQIKESLQRLSLPALNQQQIRRSIQKVVNSASEKFTMLQHQPGEEDISSLIIRFCLQSNGAMEPAAGMPAEAGQARCWGFFLVESNTQKSKAQTEKNRHVLDVFIYQE